MNVNWRWTKCARQKKRMSLLAAGALSESQRVDLEQHLAECPACQKRWQSLQRIVAQLEQQGARLPLVSPPATLRDRWQTAIRQESNRDCTQALPDAPSSRIDLSSWFSLGRLFWVGMSACWFLIAVFQGTAPDVPSPGIATGPVTFREVLLVLEKTRPQAGLSRFVQRRQSDTVPNSPGVAPRSQRFTPTAPQQCGIILVDPPRFLGSGVEKETRANPRRSNRDNSRLSMMVGQGTTMAHPCMARG